jgi:haloalkane dehalogenase
MVTESWRALYPFESRWWDRGGIKVHYIDEGKGEPVVFVHGNPTWSFYWRVLVQELSKDRRCIALDHVGMGLSDRPGEDAYEYTLKSRVDDLEGLLDHLKIWEKVTLVVHDWGGMIGMNWACRHNERVKRLIVMNTWAFDYPQEARLPWQLTLARSWVGDFLIRGLNLFSTGTVLTCARQPLPPAVAAGYLAPYRTWKDRLAVLRFVQDIPAKHEDKAWEHMKWTGDRLHKLSDVPMLLIWGGKDFVFNDVFYQEWRRRFPKAETLHLPDARHLVMEDGRDAIVPAVRTFIAAHPLARV